MSQKCKQCCATHNRVAVNVKGKPASKFCSRECGLSYRYHLTKYDKSACKAKLLARKCSNNRGNYKTI